VCESRRLGGWEVGRVGGREAGRKGGGRGRRRERERERKNTSEVSTFHNKHTHTHTGSGSVSKDWQLGDDQGGERESNESYQPETIQKLRNDRNKFATKGEVLRLQVQG
jgi:hypothetical protein